jgi:hypothetical protein
MQTTTTITTFNVEAAPAPSLPNRHMLVGDDGRFGSAIVLTGRCAG